MAYLSNFREAAQWRAGAKWVAQVTEIVSKIHQDFIWIAFGVCFRAMVAWLASPCSTHHVVHYDWRM